MGSNRSGKKARTVASVRSHRNSIRFLGFAGLLVWIATPLACIIILSIASLTTTFAPSRPILVHPRANVEDVARPVQIGLQWGSDSAVVAPSWSGVVQEVLVSPSSVLEDGTPIARIDGVIRSAAITPWPFSRVLTSGDSGEDVRQLQQFLNARGAAIPETTVIDSMTLSALSAWAESIGVSNASGVQHFDPSWVVYLPRPSSVISTDLLVGAPAPPAGTTVVSIVPELLDAVLLDSSTSERPGDASNTQPVTPTATALPSEELVYSDVRIELDEDFQRVSDAGLAALSSLLTAPSAQIAALLTQPSSADYWRIPAPAVITAVGSAACVFRSEGAAQTPVAVEVVASTGGAVIIDGPLKASDDLLVFSTSEVRTCP